MKAKYVFDVERGPTTDEEWKVYEAARLARKPNPLPMWKVGDVNDRADSYWLVKVGVAVPDDDECREACGMTEDQIADAIDAQRRLRAGQMTGDPRYDAPDEDDETDE